MKENETLFWDFWQKYWSQRIENLHGLSHHYCLQMLFYKDFSILKEIKTKVVPQGRRVRRRRRSRRRRRRTTTTSTVPWSGKNKASKCK